MYKIFIHINKNEKPTHVIFEKPKSEIFIDGIVIYVNRTWFMILIYMEYVKFNAVE